VVRDHEEAEASPAEAGLVGIDPARRGFRLHGATASGAVAVRRKLSREAVLGFPARQPRRPVATEACASAHHRGRGIAAPGHEARPIPSVHATPFVKRRKHDAADAEAIAEARRPALGSRGCRGGSR
jgi:transposase